MIAYKATTDGRCRGILFEVGKTYTYFDDLIMCLQGYHFCQKLNDVFSYYGSFPETKVMEIEVLGDVITRGDKSVTNRFKVLRFLNSEELPFIFEYDERRNIIHFKDSRIAYEWWREFNKDDLQTHYKDSKGLEYWLEYDKNKNVIHYKDTTGYEYWKTYDNEGREIYYRNQHGYEEWRSYDRYNKVHFKNNRGEEHCRY